MTIFVEVKDLLVFLRTHSSVTGIQRIVSGVISTLHHDVVQKYQDEIVFCSLVPDRQGFVAAFDEKKLRSICDNVMSGNINHDDKNNCITDIESNAKFVRPRRGDLLFFIGAYWNSYDFFHLLTPLKTNGVLIGVLVYDIIPITHPEWVPKQARRLVVDRAIAMFSSSDIFLTISDFARRELLFVLNEEMNLDKPVITVPLPQELPGNHTDNGKVLEGGHPKFVLSVGTIEGRKNHRLLFHVWAALCRKYGYENVPYLFLVGKWGGYSEEFAELCSDSNFINGRIRVLDKLSDADLASLYKNCLFTVFPSHVEGWGMPVGESLSFGKACLASNSTSIPEVGGDVVEYFDSLDVDSAFKLVEKYIFDPEAISEAEGRIASEFHPTTWDGYAERLFQAINELKLQAQEHRGATLELEESIKFRSQFGLNTQQRWAVRSKFTSLAEGWGAVEDWGCWSNSPNSVIHLELPDVKCKTYLHLELCFPPGHSGDVVTVSLGATSQIINAKAGRAVPCVISIPPGAKNVDILISRARVFGYAEPDRTLFVGIMSLRLSRSDNIDAPTESKRKIIHINTL
ncbi:glycosyltransferase family 4 protein [Methylobacterium sp. Gmos1]